MTRATLFGFVILGISVTSVLTAGDVFTGTKPTLVTSALTPAKTEMQKLKSQVNNLSFYLSEAEYQISQQQAQLDALQQSQNQILDYVDDLQGTIEIDAGGVVISAPTIELDASFVDITAATTRAGGLINCEVLNTESVISESYTPGVGNLW